MYSFLNGVMIVITGILLGGYFESLGGLILALSIWALCFIGLLRVWEEVFR